MAEPARRRVRVRYVLAALVCAAAVGWMLFGALRHNLVYLRPVSEAVEQRSEQGERRFRMGGAVVPGTIVEISGGVRFSVTEGGATVEVTHRGDPPDLFDEGAPVVVEGRWRGETFESDRLLIKHGSEYAPPTVDTGAAEGGS